MNLITSEIHTLKCSCGWQFLSLNEYEKKCPQCRDTIMTCCCCGKDISEKQTHAKYCVECAKITKKINDRALVIESRKRKYFKDTEFKICNYDCGNCLYGDCILPVDKDDFQPELF